MGKPFSACRPYQNREHPEFVLCAAVHTLCLPHRSRLFTHPIRFLQIQGIGTTYLVCILQKVSRSWKQKKPKKLSGVMTAGCNVGIWSCSFLKQKKAISGNQVCSLVGTRHQCWFLGFDELTVALQDAHLSELVKGLWLSATFASLL
jgi:hypothetical protein